jgi:hypothetical protein
MTIPTGLLMQSHLNYVTVRQLEDNLARRAERVRQEREGLARAPASVQRRGLVNLFAKLRRPAQAPAGTR